MYFFERQTKLSFSSSNLNTFYIVTSNNITNRCTLVRDFCKHFQKGFYLHQVSSPNLNRIYIHFM